MSDPAIQTEDDFDRIMDAMQALMRFEPGHVLTADEIEGLRLLDKHNREDAERAQDAFNSGYDCGLERGAGADTAKLIEERDSARTLLTVRSGLAAMREYHAFREGAQVCREMMARFVEQGGDPTTANSIRQNWRPSWGNDPGVPNEESYVAAAPCDIRERMNADRDAAA